MARQEPSPIVQELRGIGFTELEAQIYAFLVTADQPMTGYEVAKNLGMSRANAYAALRRLQQRGVVLHEPAKTGTRYGAVSFEALAAWTLDDMQERVRRLHQLIKPRPLPHGIWKGEGWRAFSYQASHLVRDAKQELAVGASAVPLQSLADPLKEARERSLPIQFGCWDACPPIGCGVCEPPFALLKSTGLETPCVVVADRQTAIVAQGIKNDASIVVTDFAPLVQGLLALITPLHDAHVQSVELGTRPVISPERSPL